MNAPILASRRRRVCAIAVLLLALVAACNRFVDLTPGDAFEGLPDAADLTDAAGATPPPPDAANGGADAPPVDAMPDAI